MLYRRGRPQIGWFGEDIVNQAAAAAAGVYDVATSVITNIRDAGDVIGTVLKFVSPIVAFWPGIGTALSVATYAAGAAAMGDRITDAALGTASSAMPPGLPRIAFDSSLAITKEIVAGREAFGAVVDACRSAAGKADPSGRALYAFDTGLAIARGGKVSAEALKLARSNVANGGPEAVAAFDAAVAVGKGEKANDVLLVVARDYVASSGGPLALAAFDTGVALSHGQTLQDAGFVALQGYVEGSEVGERAVQFLEKIVRASETGQPLIALLVTELRQDVARVVGAIGVDRALAPVLEALRVNPAYLDYASDEWAAAWSIAEPIVRAAKQVFRDPDLAPLLRPPLKLASASLEVANQPVGVFQYAVRTTETIAASPIRSVVGFANAAAAAPVAVPPKPPPPRFVPPPAPTSAAGIVAGAAPISSSDTATTIVASGVVVAAGVALFFWARS